MSRQKERKAEKKRKKRGLTLTWLEVWMCKHRLLMFGFLSR
jgi:hypothetical protein